MKNNLKHGLSNSKEYYKYLCIKQRCYNKNSKSYKYYGERGINLFEPWKNDFMKFYNYIKSLPDYGKENYSLDRIDNNGNYEPNNLRWSSRHIQCTNQRMRKDNKSNYVGITKHLNKYECGITINKIYYYLGIYDTPEEALKIRNKYITDNNLTEYIIQEFKK
jgi:hypothetical protein